MAGRGVAAPPPELPGVRFSGGPMLRLRIPLVSLAAAAPTPAELVQQVAAAHPKAAPLFFQGMDDALGLGGLPQLHLGVAAGEEEGGAAAAHEALVFLPFNRSGLWPPSGASRLQSCRQNCALRTTPRARRTS